jgi:hypothetical protein
MIDLEAIRRHCNAILYGDDDGYYDHAHCLATDVPELLGELEWLRAKNVALATEIAANQNSIARLQDEIEDLGGDIETSTEHN